MLVVKVGYSTGLTSVPLVEKLGDWRFISRVINPSNHSDWLWVLGDDGDTIPTAPPAFLRPDHIILEENVAEWAWLRTGDFGKDGGTVNTLQDGENVMMIWTRQSSNQTQYDVFCWSSDLDYETDRRRLRER